MARRSIEEDPQQVSDMSKALRSTDTWSARLLVTVLDSLEEKVRRSNMKSGVKRWPADKWFSLCVRLAADNICENCGGYATDCAHIYGRRKYTVRWSKDNAIALCRTCHEKFGEEPCMWVDFIDSNWPGRRERIQFKMMGVAKNTPNTRQAISTHYNSEYRRMEKTGDREFESWN